MAVPPSPTLPALGRYELDFELARGGMATVFLGRARGVARPVAVKRLLPQFAADPAFVEMFVDEAKIALRLKHPNLVAVHDVVAAETELLLVMDYICGATVQRLPPQVPAPIAVAIAIDALHGLHAAHQANDENGAPLSLVHRDISPDNLIAGADGVTRVLDFGIAKATTSAHVTKDGKVKGKLGYVSPEVLRGNPATRRSDVYALSVVLWEMLAGKRLIDAPTESAAVEAVLFGTIEAPHVSAELDAVVMKGLARKPDGRFESAAQMAEQLERALRPATRVEVGAWVLAHGGDRLREEQKRVQAFAAAQPVPASHPGGDETTQPAVELERTDLVTAPTEVHTRVPLPGRRAPVEPRPARERPVVLPWLVLGGLALLCVGLAVYLLLTPGSSP
jgi:serine/threonine-protein kinase